jgi:hypothetical protein
MANSPEFGDASSMYLGGTTACCLNRLLRMRRQIGTLNRLQLGFVKHDAPTRDVKHPNPCSPFWLWV